MKKAFFNLIKNAFEAIEEQGTITLRHYVEEEQLVISIMDTGMGISKEKIRLLGTPFFTSKETGTGMGLTQVYSTIYEHQGKIEVSSQVGQGTCFKMIFPVQVNQDIGVKKLNVVYEEKLSFNDFYEKNQAVFQDALLKQGKSLWDSLRNMEGLKEEFLLSFAGEIVQLLNKKDEYGLIMHAKEHGKNWAKLDLELILIMDWFQLLKQLYWDLLYHYYENRNIDTLSFFELERKVNHDIDTYIKHFSSSFSVFKNDLLLTQSELIEDLNVPIIPLTDSMAILPIIGMVDTKRAKNIQIRVLEQIHKQELKHVIIDLSGVAYLDTGVLSHLFHIINGIRIQGCKAVLTGIRPEITNSIVELGIDLNGKVETKGTLKRAISEYNQSVSFIK
ncbi:MAG: ATP-binding protein [Heyndrickxia sp.]